MKRAFTARGGSSAALVERFLSLQALVQAEMRAAIPEALRDELSAATPHQLQALSALGSDGLTMRELAALLGVSGPAACMLADRLVTKAFAERRSDPSDRRVVRLVATPAGRGLALGYEEAQRYAAGAMFARLSRQQIAAWLDVMECLAGGETREVAVMPTRPGAAAPV